MAIAVRLYASAMIAPIKWLRLIAFHVTRLAQLKLNALDYAL